MFLVVRNQYATEDITNDHKKLVGTNLEVQISIDVAETVNIFNVVGVYLIH